MRPVQLADIEIAVRVLMQLPPEARVPLMQSMITETVRADTYRQLHGTPHPQYGAGSLLSRAVRMQTAARPAALDADTLHAYRIVIDALLTHQS